MARHRRKWVCWNSSVGETRRERETQRFTYVNAARVHSAPFLSCVLGNQKRERLFCFCRAYFRCLLKTSAAAASTIMMTAAPIAMYVVVGMPLVGGIIAGLGEGEAV